MFKKIASMFGFWGNIPMDNTLNLPEDRSSEHTKIVYMPRTGENRFKPFYIHRQTPYKRGKHHKRGFTCYIEPGPDDRKVAVRITWCSGKDEFVKKLGRSYARQAPAQYINPRDLPGWLAERDSELNPWTTDGRFLYVLKYLL